MLRRFAVLLGLLSITACAETFDAASLGVPVTMAAPVGEVPQGQAFKLNKSSVFMFWGLVTLTAPSLEGELATQLIGGKAVSNLKIRVHSTWSDFLISAVTLGLVVPRSVTFEGVITGESPPPAKPD